MANKHTQFAYVAHTPRRRGSIWSTLSCIAGLAVLILLALEAAFAQGIIQ